MFNYISQDGSLVTIDEHFEQYNFGGFTFDDKKNTVFFTYEGGYFSLDDQNRIICGNIIVTPPHNNRVRKIVCKADNMEICLVLYDDDKLDLLYRDNNIEYRLWHIMDNVEDVVWTDNSGLRFFTLTYNELVDVHILDIVNRLSTIEPILFEGKVKQIMCYGANLVVLDKFDDLWFEGTPYDFRRVFHRKIRQSLGNFYKYTTDFPAPIDNVSLRCGPSIHTDFQLTFLLTNGEVFALNDKYKGKRKLPFVDPIKEIYSKKDMCYAIDVNNNILLSKYVFNMWRLRFNRDLPLARRLPNNLTRKNIATTSFKLNKFAKKEKTFVPFCTKYSVVSRYTPTASENVKPPINTKPKLIRATRTKNTFVGKRRNDLPVSRIKTRSDNMVDFWELY